MGCSGQDTSDGNVTLTLTAKDAAVTQTFANAQDAFATGAGMIVLALACGAHLPDGFDEALRKGAREAKVLLTAMPLSHIEITKGGAD